MSVFNPYKDYHIFVYLQEKNNTLTIMRIKVFHLFFLAATLLMTASCDDSRTVKNLYDDWWPVHASGSQENDYFKATWDGDLNSNGGIEVTFVDKTNPTIHYTQMIYYKALSFKKDHKHFTYIDVSSMDYTSSRQLLFYVKDKKIYFEKMNNAGRGSGEYEEGKDINFVNDDHVKIENVTYERFSVYYEAHRPYGSKEAILTEIPIAVYE